MQRTWYFFLVTWLGGPRGGVGVGGGTTEWKGGPKEALLTLHGNLSVRKGAGTGQRMGGHLDSEMTFS